MGRSVNYLSHSEQVCYEDTSSFGMRVYYACTNDECDECNDSTHFDEYEAETNGSTVTLCCPECKQPLTEREDYDDFQGQEDFDYFIEYLQEQFMKKYKSLVTCDKYEHRDETSIILFNDFVEIGISEYCGLTSISMRIREYIREPEYNEDASKLGLAQRFANNMSIWMSKNIGDLNKIGTFSNGESVYRKKGN
jgi:hypothetical protein